MIFGLKHKRIMACAVSIMLLLTACGAADSDKAVFTEGEESLSAAKLSEKENGGTEKKIVVGFSQLGAESDWRRAHSDSMRKELTAENGFELLFEDGQQKQANQIMAIRTFIQRDVDVIVLAPVTETGWDSVLSEAAEAGIPVIIVDRRVDIENEELFSCWLGSDFELEGKKATAWLYEYAKAKGIDQKDLHIVNIQGTLGSSAQIGRSKGLREACDKYGWDLKQQISGDFTQTKGREVTTSMLRLYQDINVIYCENDNEALGAIEAIEAEGKVPGMDIQNGEIMVLSFDGMNKEALQYAREGKIACIAECNPLHGQKVAELIRQLVAGETPEKYSYVEEDFFSGSDLVKSLTIDDEEYPVTKLTQEVIDARQF